MLPRRADYRGLNTRAGILSGSCGAAVEGVGWRVKASDMSAHQEVPYAPDVSERDGLMADNNRSVLVVGLGRFGSSVASTLDELGQDVLAVDKDPVLVNR